jgi:hypothetical protein
MALSDVWLDKPAVMSALKTLLTGVTSMGPGVLVLMGNFISDPKLAVSAQSQLMSQLGKVLQVLAHKEVKGQCRTVRSIDPAPLTGAIFRS